MSVRNYHCTLHNIPVERRSHLLGGGGLIYGVADQNLKEKWASPALSNTTAYILLSLRDVLEIGTDVSGKQFAAVFSTE